MVWYFVSPRERTDLHLDADRFATEVRAAWPDAQVRLSADPADAHRLAWEVPMTHRTLSGSLNPAGAVVALSGDVRDAARFALWVRRRVPAAYDLFFYDEAYSADVAVREDTTEVDLAAPFLLPPLPPA